MRHSGAESLAEYKRQGYNEEQVELGRMTPEEITAWVRGWSESGGPEQLGMEVRFDEGVGDETTFDVKKDMEIKSKQISLEYITPEIEVSKPRYSPDIKKWLDAGGKLSIDFYGNWIYTNFKKQSVVYINGYPDFKKSGFVLQEVNSAKGTSIS